MHLFGKELFTFKKPAGKMYDFAQHGLLNFSGSFDLNTYTQMVPPTPIDGVMAETAKAKKEDRPTISPKHLFETKALNDHQFQIKIDEAYLVEQLDIAQYKLDLLGKKPKMKKDGGMMFEGERGTTKYGRMEVESIVERLKNRRKISAFQNVLDTYPHTTSKLINDVVNAHANLVCDGAGQFVPDFPKTAIKAMKEYDAMCLELCNKKAIFYVIADKKDFQKIPAKRDPILLAQSPFGFFWQILGAWDDEMIYLGDL